MAVTLRKFIREFPVFRNTDQTLVELKIAAATAQIAAPVWGAKADQGISNLAAHLLAINPMGEDARLDQDVKMTVYLAEYNRLKRQVSYGFRVT